ncbi:MAG: DNA-directed RNA polymerase subunit H [Candidatus Aenigmatarchaeota archaeon]
MLEKEYDILKHALVPEHAVLGEKEMKELFEKLKITSVNLPKVLTNDPVVKAMDAKEGDVLKIVRKSPTAGSTTYYRVVVKK